MGRKASKIQGKVFGLIIIFSLGFNVSASIDNSINNHKEHFSKIALQIWDNAELGYQETESSKLLSDALEKEGFEINKAVAGIPTAFIAEFGSKGPVIAILGEFDALIDELDDCFLSITRQKKAQLNNKIKRKFL